MLWRVRATLPDRPGALAELARVCGEAGVNILGVQIFPGVDAVTDEMVLRTPSGWTERRLGDLVAGAGGSEARAIPCTEQALIDQPTRYVEAARAIVAAPSRFPEVVARLFDAESEPPASASAGSASAGGGSVGGGSDVMEMTVGNVAVQIRRQAPFTPTEHARGAAIAELVNDVLARTSGARPPVPPMPRSPDRPATGTSGPPEYVADGHGVTAWVSGTVVGRATLDGDGPEPGVRKVDLSVDTAWLRRGIGTRLLTDVARLAAGDGVAEIVIETAADNQAVLPMVLGAGLRGRIRMSGETLTVRIPVRDLKPLPV